MVSIGVTEKYFKFKTINPIHPEIQKRITDPNFWQRKKDEPWNQK